MIPKNLCNGVTFANFYLFVPTAIPEATHCNINNGTFLCLLIYSIYKFQGNQDVHIIPIITWGFFVKVQISYGYYIFIQVLISILKEQQYALIIPNSLHCIQVFINKIDSDSLVLISYHVIS